jgi:hypothetical protein
MMVSLGRESSRDMNWNTEGSIIVDVCPCTSAPYAALLRILQNVHDPESVY